MKRKIKQIGVEASLLKRRIRMAVRNPRAQSVREARAKRQRDRLMAMQAGAETTE